MQMRPVLFCAFRRFIRQCLIFSPIFLASCGGGGAGNDASAPPAPTNPNPVQLVVIGNSMAANTAAPQIGWMHTSGMAASSEDKDYSHLVAKALGVTGAGLYIRNFVPLEGDPIGSQSMIPDAIAAFAVYPRTRLVVVELGDNADASTPAIFDKGYRALLSKAAPYTMQLLCVSTFWGRPSIDTVIKNACVDYGGRYVYVGDIFNAPDNPERTVREYVRDDVNNHPRDWSMARIAERILAAVM